MACYACQRPCKPDDGRLVQPEDLRSVKTDASAPSRNRTPDLLVMQDASGVPGRPEFTALRWKQRRGRTMELPPSSSGLLPSPGSLATAGKAFACGPVSPCQKHQAQLRCQPATYRCSPNLLQWAPQAERRYLDGGSKQAEAAAVGWGRGVSAAHLTWTRG